MKKSIFFIATIAVILLTLPACKKLIVIPAPKTQVSSGTVFADLQTANAAVVGLYSQMMKSEGYLENGGLSIFGGILADDIITPVAGSEYDPFQDNALTAQNFTVYYNFWYASYSNIYHANSIIEKLGLAAGLDLVEKSKLIGAAKLVRSFYYFNLINLFGDVPLITSPDYQNNARASRTPIDSVYRFLVNDLLSAEQELPSPYTSSDRIRPSKVVASALLSRIFLFTGNWAAAAEEASKVINTPELSLNPPGEIGLVFLASSPEIIWQLPQVQNDDVNSVEGLNFIPNPGEVPQFTITESLLNSFDQTDLRRQNWIDSTTVDGTVYYYPYKYKTKYSPDKNENNILLRLAEQYLIRSEAYMQLHRIDESLEDLNIVRARAGLSAISTGISTGELAGFIALENRHEYFAELGHRWFDLKRTNSINSILSIAKGSNWQATDALFPIPLPEIQRDRNLLQNPGY